jgi:hypothetical protein
VYAVTLNVSYTYSVNSDLYGSFTEAHCMQLLGWLVGRTCWIIASFEAVTAVMFQVKVFWVVVGYQRFERPCCLHLQREVAGVSMPFSSTPATSPWRWRQHGPLKCWYPTTILHGVTTRKTLTWNVEVLSQRYQAVDRGPLSVFTVPQNLVKIIHILPQLEILIFYTFFVFF